MPKPLVIELFAGRFGWGKGFVAEGWRCIGFDILHEQWHRPVPPGCELVLQDVLTLHGSQFRDAAAIVASPPCQKYSWMAMPWDRSKREIRWQQWMRDSPLSPGFRLNDLFDACFRIQREAIEATARDCPACGGKGFVIWYANDCRPCERCDGKGWVTRYIPMVVENVKGAQPWVGRAKWHFGSFYLYGDVPALMPIVVKHRKSSHVPMVETPPGVGKTSWFHGNSKHEGRNYGVKVASESGRRTDPGKGARFTSRDCGIEVMESTAVKGMNGLHGLSHPDGKGSGDLGGPNDPRRLSSKSVLRKAASAAIAEIPFELSSHIARVFYPLRQTPDYRYLR